MSEPTAEERATRVRDDCPHCDCCACAECIATAIKSAESAARKQAFKEAMEWHETRELTWGAEADDTSGQYAARFHGMERAHRESVEYFQSLSESKG